MAKAKGKRTQTAAQKRAQADLAAFRAIEGRSPNKGESTKGYSGRSGAKGKSSARSRGAKKAAETRSKLGYKLRRLVRRHPFVSTGVGLGVTAGTVYVASDRVRARVNQSLSR